MTEDEGSPARDIAARDDFELRLGADLAHLPLIRSMTANVAMRADFDLDAIADLRLAVDEACSTLITRAITGSTMTCRFTIDGDQLRVDAAVDSAEPSPPSTNSFAWHVLSTLTDAAETWVSPNGDAHLLTVHLAKRKPVTAG